MHFGVSRQHKQRMAARMAVMWNSAAELLLCRRAQVKKIAMLSQVMDAFCKLVSMMCTAGNPMRLNTLLPMCKLIPRCSSARLAGCYRVCRWVSLPTLPLFVSKADACDRITR